MRVFLAVWSLVFLRLVLPSGVLAANCDEISCNKDNQSTEDYLQCNKNKQTCWEESIKNARESGITLKNTITLLNGQISLQQLQIDQTLAEINALEQEIVQLTQLISQLQYSLDQLGQILIERIRGQYKRDRVLQSMDLISSGSFSQWVTAMKHVSAAQQQTVDALHRTESQRLVFDQQRALKEQKQDQLAEKKKKLVAQQSQLTKQRADQQYLLKQTQNDEARFQKELAKTLSELQAIQSILAGKGSESAVKTVKEGDVIASIIRGASACSTGTHLHFEVVKDSLNYDPASFLSNASINWSNDPDGPFSFGGSWAWPVFDAARITQGYGQTYYARVRRAYGGAPHTGIDMVSKSDNYNVRAGKEGE